MYRFGAYELLRSKALALAITTIAGEKSNHTDEKPISNNKHLPRTDFSLCQCARATFARPMLLLLFSTSK